MRGPLQIEADPALFVAICIGRGRAQRTSGFCQSIRGLLLFMYESSTPVHKHIRHQAAQRSHQEEH